jgi:hypothetical protein
MANLVWVIATLVFAAIVIVMDDSTWDRKKSK